MAAYPIHTVGKDITSDEFLATLADNDCVEVRFEICVITGTIVISKDIILPDKKGRFVIDKEINCIGCTFQKAVRFGGVIFKQEICFAESIFEQGVSFGKSTFKHIADFRKVTFEKYADFSNVIFKQGPSFYTATFKGEAFFNKAMFGEATNYSVAQFQNATFHKKAGFIRSFFAQPAVFEKVCYYPNTLRHWWRKKLFKTWRLPKNYPEGKLGTPTEFYLDSQNIDEVSNPRFKRYVADQQYIRAFREEHRFLAEVWRWSSDYGRSFGLWAFWSAWIALIFSCGYAHKQWSFIGLIGVILLIVCVGNVWRIIKLRHSVLQKFLRCSAGVVLTVILLIGIYWASLTINQLEFAVSGREFTLTLSIKDFHLEFASPERIPNFITYLYFSVVTFTTLGFGDITPLNNISEIWLTIEVILVLHHARWSY